MLKKMKKLSSELQFRILKEEQDLSYVYFDENLFPKLLKDVKITLKEQKMCLKKIDLRTATIKPCTQSLTEDCFLKDM